MSGLPAQWAGLATTRVRALAIGFCPLCLPRIPSPLLHQHRACLPQACRLPWMPPTSPLLCSSSGLQVMATLPLSVCLLPLNSPPLRRLLPAHLFLHSCSQCPLLPLSPFRCSQCSGSYIYRGFGRSTMRWLVESVNCRAPVVHHQLLRCASAASPNTEIGETLSGGRGKNDATQETMFWNEKNPGVRVEPSNKNAFKFIFTKLDAKNPEREFSFSIGRDKISNLYTMLDCDPAVERSGEFLEELNHTNELFQFITNMCNQFQADLPG